MGPNPKDAIFLRKIEAIFRRKIDQQMMRRGAWLQMTMN